MYKHLAQICSIIFFPVLIPFYAIVFLLYYDTHYFIGIHDLIKIKILSSGFLNLIFLPIVTLLLLKKIGLTTSYAQNKKDKIILLFALSLFYFWTFYVFKNLGEIPRFMIRLQLNYFVCIALAPVFLYFYNINIYVASISTLFVTLIFSPNQPYFSYPLLMFSLLAMGVILSHQLYQAHSIKDIKRSCYMVSLGCFIGHIIMRFI